MKGGFLLLANECHIPEVERTILICADVGRFFDYAITRWPGSHRYLRSHHKVISTYNDLINSKESAIVRTHRIKSIEE